MTVVSFFSKQPLDDGTNPSIASVHGFAWMIALCAMLTMICAAATWSFAQPVDDNQTILTSFGSSAPQLPGSEFRTSMSTR
jgi:hypothetical protein